MLLLRRSSEQLGDFILSVIVYGRNDSYGYNLHKRVAISLNNISFLLTHENDEIIFVDYNSPRGLGTLPEAIADTLTSATKSRLRVIRFSEAQHASLPISTHLKVLEPHARNVALRRTNPRNRWVLNTNTDMVFVPRRGHSLSDITVRLTDGQYGLPRFELPAGLWEQLDRKKPRETMSRVSEWGEYFGLNVVAESWEPHMFDAPGDFQLMLRRDLFAIQGFNEAMVRGWHVDSNISRRLSMVRGRALSLSGELAGYHCDHTRQETPMHRAGATQNSTLTYIDLVRKPDLPGQRESWGLPHLSLPEISLSRKKQSSLTAALWTISKMLGPAELPARRYNASGFNKDAPDDRTILTYLLDLLVAEPSPPAMAWVGADKSSYRKFRQIASENGWILRSSFFSPGLKSHEIRQIAKADFIVLDFRTLQGEAQVSKIPPRESRVRHEVEKALVQIASRHSLTGQPRLAQRYVGIDVVNTQSETLFHSIISASRTPYVIGIRHGFLAKHSRLRLLKHRFSFARRALKFLRRELIGDENVYGLLARSLWFRATRRVFERITSTN